jgi:hypothetical protein
VPPLLLVVLHGRAWDLARNTITALLFFVLHLALDLLERHARQRIGHSPSTPNRTTGWPPRRTAPVVYDTRPRNR